MKTIAAFFVRRVVVRAKQSISISDEKFQGYPQSLLVTMSTESSNAEFFFLFMVTLLITCVYIKFILSIKNLM